MSRRYNDQTMVRDKGNDAQGCGVGIWVLMWGWPLALAVILSISPIPVIASDVALDRTQIPASLLFARLTTERKSFYSQEIFDLTLTVYSSGLNMGREILLSDLEGAGLISFPFHDRGVRREVINGKVFDAHRFLGQAQAASAGTYKLQPTVRTEVIVSRQSRGGAEVRQVILHPALLIVEVRQLPERGKPEGFTGAVGNFAFSAAAKPATVAEGAPVTLTMVVTGHGNFESIAAPQVKVGDRFKLYEPKLLSTENRKDHSPGRLVFEQILIPLSAASTMIPAFSFSFFDPASKSYREILAGPFPLLVTSSGMPGGVMAEAPSSGPESKNLTPLTEIAHLKSEPRDWSGLQSRPWYTLPWFLALQCLPLAIMVAAYYGVRRRDERSRDVGKVRRQLAPSAAREGIITAEQALQNDDPAQFHDALWEALSSYFGHRFNLLPGEISAEIVTERLSESGLDLGVVARLNELFQLSEQERFGRRLSVAAPMLLQERRKLSGMLDELGVLLEECEKVRL